MLELGWFVEPVIVNKRMEINMKRLVHNFGLIKEFLDKKSFKIIKLNILIMFVSAILQPIISYFYKIIIDLLSATLFDYPIVFIIILLYILSQITIDIMELINSHIQIKMQYNIQSKLFSLITDKISKIKLEELEKVVTYDYLDRINNAIVSSVIKFIQDIIGIVSPVVIIAGYSFALFKVKWYFPCVIIFSALPYLYMCIKKVTMNYAQEVELNKEERKLNYFISLLMERKSVKEIRLFKLTNFFDNIIRVQRRKIFKIKMILSIKFCLYEIVLAFVHNFGMAICVVVTCMDIVHNRSGLGNFVLVMGAAQAIVNSMISLFITISDINEVSLYFNDWEEFKNIPEFSKKKQEKIKDYTITLENVSFRYHGIQNNTLNNINITIEQNQKVAIVGENGSGKSTLLNILLGLYEPSSGIVKIGNNELSEVIDDFRNITVPLFQKFIRYQFTLKENLQIGNFGNSIKLSDNDNFRMDRLINSLPNGIDTELGQLREGAHELSGGEWQKVCIQRTLLRENSKILIMDEPTSSLDPIIENEFYEKFTSLADGKTVVIVSHRLSITKLCDKIVVIDKGNIVEQGTHEELMENRGRYYNMFVTQSRMYN